MADPKYWRLYQFAFVGLRNSTQIYHTMSGKKHKTSEIAFVVQSIGWNLYFYIYTLIFIL